MNGQQKNQTGNKYVYNFKVIVNTLYEKYL